MLEHSWRQKVGKVLHKKYKLITYLYLALMLLFYMCYILLESNRQNKSDYWISKINLTQENIQSISLLGTWTSVTEVMFLALFIIVASIVLVFYRKDKNMFKRFLLIHIGLFLAILLLSYALTLITPLPIGNLTQPIISPLLLLGILSIYLGLLRIKEI